MVDPPARRRGDRGLRAKGDAEPGGGEHRQIVGAVANRERLAEGDPTLCRQAQQRVPLGRSGDERGADGAGDPAAGNIEPVGDDAGKAEMRPHRLGEGGETARDQRGYGAGGTHRCDQRAGARRQPDMAGGLVEHGLRQAFQEGDPLGKRRDEVDLAVHRPPGDFGDRRAQADELGQFLEHFVFDDRRFHVGDEEAFPPPGARLDHHVDRGCADHLPRGRRGGLGAGAGAEQVAGHAGSEPVGAGSSDDAGERSGAAGENLGAARPGDQGDDQVQAALASGATPLVVIAGPTASGKSALALELAAAFRGVIINADSMQVYRDLRILTARPDPAAEARVPHRLYGFLDAAERGSVARWRELAEREISAATAAGRLPFLVGGTGLYLRALLEGLAPVPEVPAAVRNAGAALYRELGGDEFHRQLGLLDPAAAARLRPGDRQRLVRAWEVAQATGASLDAWHRAAPAPTPYRVATIVLMPPRARLYAACDARFAAMVAAGGIDEVAALAARGLAPDLPAMKAVGVPELLRYLRGELALTDAIAAGQQATRRYAKRQMTWFRHQLRADLIVDEQFSESLLHRLRHFIYEFLLTVQG